MAPKVNLPTGPCYLTPTQVELLLATKHIEPDPHDDAPDSYRPVHGTPPGEIINKTLAAERKVERF